MEVFMVTILINLFIKDKDNTSSPKVRLSYGILCGIVGIFLNVVLFLGKLIGGLFSNSIAITADAFNNLSDAGSSLITLIGFKMAGQKPDHNHPFGHGRIEYLSGLLVSIAILIMSFELIKSSIKKIIHPSDVVFNPIVIVILIASILVKLYMSFYNHSIGKKINSAAMKVTATDSISDTFATSAVLIAILVNHVTSLKIDGYCGFLVGIFIFFAGISAAKETIAPLLGQSPSKEFVSSIEDIVMSHGDILGIHDLIVHDYGPGRLMITLHAEVPASGDMFELHDLIDNIEHDLREELNCHAVIHLDPVMNNDTETIELKEKVTKILNNIDSSLTLHDFRIVKGPTHSNIIFDVMVIYTFEMSDQELKEMIQAQVHQINPNYNTVIDIDKDYNIV